jgi:hypothetical protein
MLDGVEFGAFGAGHADFGVPSNGLQNIVFKAEVVELADTPSKSVNFAFSVTSIQSVK